MNEMNFYPGPSKLHPTLKKSLMEAYESGILTRNHRSEEFMKLMQSCKNHLHSILNIPEEFQIAFVSSATEAWEISIQSLVQKSATIFHNGSFGEKWGNFAHDLVGGVESVPFSLDGLPALEQVKEEDELIGMVQNETSNGTAIPAIFMEKVRKQFPSKLIAYDVTSSIAGIELDWRVGDFWFASVQKCFGLPSGMGLLVVSPQAAEKAKKEESNRYNSLQSILRHASTNQTHYTPNILDIYLLNDSLKDKSAIAEQSKIIRDRKLKYSGKFADLGLFELVWNEILTSDTVFCLEIPREKMSLLKDSARQEGIILGNGYGKWKDNTIRLANFPAITDDEFQRLFNFFEKILAT